METFSSSDSEAGASNRLPTPPTRPRASYKSPPSNSRQHSASRPSREGQAGSSGSRHHGGSGGGTELLTLEAIKADLGLFSTTQNFQVHDRGKENHPRGVAPDPNVDKLLFLCFELLELAHHLEASRSDTARDWTEKCQVVRQFERLYDSVRDREIQFKSKVAEQKRKFQMRESKYANIKKRARQHLRECQADRDQFFLNATNSINRANEVDEDLSRVVAALEEQRRELTRLKEKARSMPTEKESTELNLQLRSLQNENAQLLTDNATLKLALDELAATVQKRLSTTQTPPESLTMVFNTMAPDDLRLKSPRFEADESGVRNRGFQQSGAAEIAQLERQCNELQTMIKEQRTRNDEELSELKEQITKYQKYKKLLEGMLRDKGVTYPTR